ncbi:acyltransferase [Pararobbsia alpina]|uniref:Galactoside O-acetyltransferase n=1 Tax=Pararobbsia alpina TaxID=621374 RepID=A0A6S7B0U6_9BURK|nr:acyltransferase [Pararobbsia alpina]CAB3781806.1 Galactoside O-acetyltransferase [Pararobbsia alpina]
MNRLLDLVRNPLANLTLAILPATRGFALKRALLNTLGFEIGVGAKLTGGVKFYGRGRIAIGEDSWIGLGTLFIVAPDAAIVIGARCDIAPRVIFHTGSHRVGDHRRRAGAGYSQPITIADGSWVGTGSVVLGGSCIGSASILAAGATLLAGDYPADTLLAGCPATIKRAL